MGYPGIKHVFIKEAKLNSEGVAYVNSKLEELEELKKSFAYDAKDGCFGRNLYYRKESDLVAELIIDHTNELNYKKKEREKLQAEINGLGLGQKSLTNEVFQVRELIHNFNALPWYKRIFNTINLNKIK